MAQGKAGDVGILIVSHGDLSEHLIEAARLIYQDELDDIQALSVSTKLDRDQVMAKAQKTLDAFAPNIDKVIVLCDMHGATPSRLICETGFDGYDIHCVFGANLSMLVDCINYRNEEGEDLAKLAERICATGRSAIFTKKAGQNGG